MKEPATIAWQQQLSLYQEWVRLHDYLKSAFRHD
jgi:hypothetical protein